MFSKPNAGWSIINIEGFRGYASYIQPFVCETLSAITQHLENGSSQCVNYDEEGSDFTIVFTKQEQIYLITSREYLNITALKITPFDLAKEIVKDFETYKSEWDDFVCLELGCDEDTLDIEKECYLDNFNELLEYLKYIINKEEEKNEKHK